MRLPQGIVPSAEDLHYDPKNDKLAGKEEREAREEKHERSRKEMERRRESEAEAEAEAKKERSGAKRSEIEEKEERRSRKEEKRESSDSMRCMTVDLLSRCYDSEAKADALSDCDSGAETDSRTARAS